jgi:hypothetical protein
MVSVARDLCHEARDGVICMKKQTARWGSAPQRDSIAVTGTLDPFWGCRHRVRVANFEQPESVKKGGFELF